MRRLLAAATERYPWARRFPPYLYYRKQMDGILPAIMNSPRPQRLLSTVGAMTLISFISGCTLFTPQPKGQIVVQVVSWPLVKKYAEPDAGLPGHKVVLQSA
jgi:hypothetical protein